MKVITANFVTCAVKECKTSAASFPLHFHDAELEQQELDFQPEFIRNVLPRIDWESLRVTANEVRLITNIYGQHRCPLKRKFLDIFLESTSG
jgi:hypothetical protein